MTKEEEGEEGEADRLDRGGERELGAVAGDGPAGLLEDVPSLHPSPPEIIRKSEPDSRVKFM